MIHRPENTTWQQNVIHSGFAPMFGRLLLLLFKGNTHIAVKTFIYRTCEEMTDVLQVWWSFAENPEDGNLSLIHVSEHLFVCLSKRQSVFSAFCDFVKNFVGNNVCTFCCTTFIVIVKSLWSTFRNRPVGTALFDSYIVLNAIQVLVLHKPENFGTISRIKVSKC